MLAAAAALPPPVFGLSDRLNVAVLAILTSVEVRAAEVLSGFLQRLTHVELADYAVTLLRFPRFFLGLLSLPPGLVRLSTAAPLRLHKLFSHVLARATVFDAALPALIVPQQAGHIVLGEGCGGVERRVSEVVRGSRVCAVVQ